MRQLITQDPILHDPGKYLFERSPWPARWIGHPEAHSGEALVCAYLRKFEVSEQITLRIHVTANERYDLFLDGQLIGRGSEVGDRDNWFYDTYDLAFSPGNHTLVARVWWLGPGAPSGIARISVRPGFFLLSEGAGLDLLSTGIAEWKVKKLEGYTFAKAAVKDAYCAVDARVTMDGQKVAWGFERGDGENWLSPRVLATAALRSVVNECSREWVLRPTTLPPMHQSDRKSAAVRHVSAPTDETEHPLRVNPDDHRAADAQLWSQMITDQKSLIIDKQSSVRVIVDLNEYCCAHTELATTGGRASSVRIAWAESLYEQSSGHAKGNREHVDGKYFRGMYDMFLPDGGANRVFEPAWWMAGRYIEILVRTNDQALTIHGLKIRETHYPLLFESCFDCSDDRLNRVIPIALRSLLMCAHQTYVDCPYYEQLCYVGDTRLASLITYVTAQDDRLARKAIEMFDRSRLNSGLTQARYPSRVAQVIPPFALFWVGMVHDFAMWRDDPDFVKARMPGVRAVLEALRSWISSDGLISSPPGWNFIDWVPGWDSGMPPGAYSGENACINLLGVMALRMAAELEDFANEPELATRHRKTADAISVASERCFFDPARKLMAEDRNHTHFSEHAQSLALLAGLTPSVRNALVENLFSENQLSRTTIYFTHYLFEAARITGKMEHFFDRMSLWFVLERLGLKTTFEMPEPTRSDCHAWGAHPVFHYFASVLGIRPTSPGFRTVRIEPQLHTLAWAKGSMVHPRGRIIVDLEQEKSVLRGSITLPDGVTGIFVHGGKTTPLKPGLQSLG